MHLTEPLGDVTILDVDVGGAQLSRACSPEELAASYAPGQPIELSFRLADAHYFMTETGTIGLTEFQAAHSPRSLAGPSTNDHVARQSGRHNVGTTTEEIARTTDERHTSMHDTLMATAVA